MKIDYQVELCDGKYTYIRHEKGGQEALRYGKKWRDLTGDNLVYWFAVKVGQLEQELQQARNEIARLNGQTNFACECGGTKVELQQAREREGWIAAECSKLQSQLSQAQKYCWNNMVCIHHTDRERAAAIGHCPVCVENQLSQWQECAREMARAMTMIQEHRHLDIHSCPCPLELDKALSLFTKLTSTTTKE